MSSDNVETSRWATGHKPIVSFRIVQNVPKPPAELVRSFRDCSVPDIADLVGQLYTLDSGLRPLYSPMKKLVGIALTVKIAPGDNSVVKRAMRIAREGDVLVIDARGHTETCAGGAGALVQPIRRGLAGVVVDGAWRDVNELQAMDFPIVGRAVSPFSGPKRRPGEINVPVCCGGVVVMAGDVIVCDTEGGVVIPRRHAQAVRDRLTTYREKQSLEDWDDLRTTQLEEERDKWFERYFTAHGGTYDDWTER